MIGTAALVVVALLHTPMVWVLIAGSIFAAIATRPPRKKEDSN